MKNNPLVITLTTFAFIFAVGIIIGYSVGRYVVHIEHAFYMEKQK